jgi:glutamate-5-semialdehyde dehydrogenase
VLPNGLRVERRRVPLGVLMMIYEARPNATIEAAVLAVKSGNAIILKGGKEAEHSNALLGAVLGEALAAAGLPPDAVQVLTGLGHDATIQLLRMPGIDLCIPRGGEALIRTVRENARMPVLAHGPGVCHVYIDEAIDLDSALAVALNAKLDRPATCNAAETMLLHQAAAPQFLPIFAERYLAAGGELRACERSRALLQPNAHLKAAMPEDFGREFLANILALKIVDNLDEAIGHIAAYGTHHSDAICTTALKSAERFVREVDSSAVFVNASTRLNDGSALGMGAELGISTSKFHSYGSMGLAALTIEKTVAFGDGHVR